MLSSLTGDESKWIAAFWEQWSRQSLDGAGYEAAAADSKFAKFSRATNDVTMIPAKQRPYSTLLATAASLLEAAGFPLKR